MIGRIIGIDPGKSTGLCVFDDGEMIYGKEAHSAEEVIDFIDEYDPDLVVMEDFIVSRRPSNAKEPIKVIGVVEFHCRKKGIKIDLQSPSVLTLMMKRADGLHGSIHVRSSCAHVLYNIEKRKMCK